jgi:hypothetical protein
MARPGHPVPRPPAEAPGGVEVSNGTKRADNSILQQIIGAHAATSRPCRLKRR